MSLGRIPPKIKLSEDQTPIPQQSASPVRPCSPAPEAAANPAPPVLPSGQRGSPIDLNNPAPRGFVGISFSLSDITMRGSAVPIARMLGTLQRYVASPIIDKTNLMGLFDFAIRFSHDGLVNFDGRPFSSNPGVMPGHRGRRSGPNPLHRDTGTWPEIGTGQRSG